METNFLRFPNKRSTILNFEESFVRRDQIQSLRRNVFRHSIGKPTHAPF